MNVTILGTGAYGLALSKMFLRNNCNVTMWTALDNEYNMLKKYRCNRLVLPSYKIDNKIKITTNMEEALKNTKLIVIAVPVKFIRSTLTEVKKYYKDNHICIASKGIEQNSYLFPYEMIKKELKTNKIGVISGGTFAIDMVNDAPVGLLIASKNSSTTKVIRKALESEMLRVDISSDVLGTEFWGSVKNIMAIGCGIIDGMNYPESTKCLFFTKCFKEITNLVYDFGGNKSTAITYAGIGDFYLTCNSAKSRNYSFGKMISGNFTKDYIDDYLEGNTVEGYYTLKSFYGLTHKKKKKSKIIDILYNIIYNNGDLKLLDEFLKK